MELSANAKINLTLDILRKREDGYHEMQMVMQAVIEEKNSRVLDVLVTSVKPFQLMVGKILGVASVAVVQVAYLGCSAFRSGCRGQFGADAQASFG